MKHETLQMVEMKQNVLITAGTEPTGSSGAKHQHQPEDRRLKEQSDVSDVSKHLSAGAQATRWMSKIC